MADEYGLDEEHFPAAVKNEGQIYINEPYGSGLPLQPGGLINETWMLPGIPWLNKEEENNGEEESI